MKAQLLLAGIILGMSGISACTGNKKNVMTEKETMEVWKDYPVGHIDLMIRLQSQKDQKFIIV